jgi:hypothetical protein
MIVSHPSWWQFKPTITGDGRDDETAPIAASNEGPRRQRPDSM